MTKTKEHLDFMNQTVTTGDFVISLGHSFGHTLACYKIIECTNKMIRIVPVRYKPKKPKKTKKAKKKPGRLFYSKDVVRIEPALVTLHYLRDV